MEQLIKDLKHFIEKYAKVLRLGQIVYSVFSDNDKEAVESIDSLKDCFFIDENIDEFISAFLLLKAYNEKDLNQWYTFNYRELYKQYKK